MRDSYKGCVGTLKKVENGHIIQIVHVSVDETNSKYFSNILYVSEATNHDHTYQYSLTDASQHDTFNTTRRLSQILKKNCSSLRTKTVDEEEAYS